MKLTIDDLLNNVLNSKEELILKALNNEELKKEFNSYFNAGRNKIHKSEKEVLEMLLNKYNIK